MGKDTPKSNGKVVTEFPQSYTAWRHARKVWSELNDRVPGTPPERLLQAVWQHQRVVAERLQLTDGTPVRILHPGFWNHGAGPDFAGALVQFGKGTPVSGDIEIDLEISGWRAHAHHQNAAFKNVVLHVVWNATGKAVDQPTLPLKDRLDAPLPELETWLDHPGIAELPSPFAGRCSAPLRELTLELRNNILRQAALVRLASKANQFQARARQAGWEQSLWEGLFRALGYRHNAWPMQRLAEAIPELRKLTGNLQSPLPWQARLLGLAGLLPSDSKIPEVRTWLRTAWDIWWRDRDMLSDWQIPTALWRRHGMRPANQPVRRLDLAAHWLADNTLPARLETWLKSQEKPDHALPSLINHLPVVQDEFWSRRWTLTGAAFHPPHPLLGHTRITDLAVNVFLPWLHARAVLGGKAKLQERIESHYLHWPAAQDNTLLRQARQRLLGGSNCAPLKTSAEQQGVLQILRDFCDHTNARCDHCQLPALIRNQTDQKTKE
ncbi:MAG TPA: DUF2851 family protein [Roseimicrobium sp.]|nr:DUF2851 family protein [Roseimicrobium sp.]